MNNHEFNKYKHKVDKCNKKKKYVSKYMAKRFRIILMNKYEKEFEIYKCDICKYWHLTTKL